MEFTIGYVCGAVMMVVAYVIICIAVGNSNKIKDKETSKSDKANNGNEAKCTLKLPDITKMTLEDVVNRKEYLETVVKCMRLLDIDADSLSAFVIDVYIYNSNLTLGRSSLHIFTEDATFKKYILDAIYKFVQDYKQSIESKQDNQPTNKSDDNQ